MFGFNFFKRPKEQDKASPDIPPPLPSYDQAIPADSRGPLVDRVVEQLEEARNKFIRIGANGGKPAELAAALFAGDMLLGKDSARLFLGRSGEGSSESLVFLRRGRGEDLHVETVKTSRLPMREIQEVVSGRLSGSPIGARVDADVMDIAKALIGDSEVGRAFRQLAVKHEPVIHAEICPERGVIERVSNGEIDPVDPANVTAVIAVSSVFDCGKDYIAAFVTQGFVTDRAKSNIAKAMFIVNSFENASRLRLMESISGL